MCAADGTDRHRVEDHRVAESHAEASIHVREHQLPRLGFREFDRRVIDGLVNLSGILVELTGQVIKLFQTGYVRNYALTFLLGVVAILFYLITQ